MQLDQHKFQKTFQFVNSNFIPLLPNIQFLSLHSPLFITASSMPNPYTQSINLNVNLINFPSPIQLSMNQKSSLRQPKSQYLINQSLPINKKHSSSCHQNFQDSFDQFHPTMSTESLCKVKKIYEKTIKNKNYGKSLDDFLNSDVEDIVKKSSKTAVIKQLNLKNSTLNHAASHNNTSKNSNNSQRSSKVSSRNSTEHMVSKQPQEIQCYDTFQEDEDFLRLDLLKNSLNVNNKSDKIFGKDLFKKNKSKGISLHQKKSFPNNQQSSEAQKDLNFFVKSQQYKCKQGGQENKPSLNNIQRSKSKSRSKSKQKSREKAKQQILRKLPSSKNIKSVNPPSKNLGTKSPIRQSTSRSPVKDPQIDTRKYKQNSKLNSQKQSKRQQSKSKSKTKNQKKFVRSNIQIQISNHHTFSPSPATKRGNKSKSFQRSRSISNHKSLSKQKKSISKSANSKNFHLNKSRSPKNQKYVKQFNLKPKDLTGNGTRQVNKSISLSKQKNKRSIINEERSQKEKEKRKMKKTVQKQEMSKQYSQQVLKSSQFSKKKLKRVKYAKADVQTSPDHSRSTNINLAERKDSIKVKQRQQKQTKGKRALKEGKQGKNGQIVNERMKMGINQDKHEQREKYQKAAVIIQSYYRGYRVRRQLNEDLREICCKVQVIRGKIEDKRSKYWIRSDVKWVVAEPQFKFRDKLRQPVKDKLRYNSAREQFESLLSSSNSIQQLSTGTPNAPQESCPMNQCQLDNQNSHSTSKSIPIDQNSKSQLLYFQQLVSKDLEQNHRFLRESEQLKQHIRSVSSEHLKSHEPSAARDQESIENKPRCPEQGNFRPELISLQQQASRISGEPFCQKQRPPKSGNQLLFKPTQKLAQLTELYPHNFEFYSPNHYILSPKNPSPSVLRMVSPISSASSFHQIPFSLQSPQNILNGENLNFQSFNRDVQKKERYFQAGSEERRNEQDDKGTSESRQDKDLKQGEVERKIEMLKKLHYEDKLLSPKTYQRKLNALSSKVECKKELQPQVKFQTEPGESVRVEQLSSDKPRTGKKVKIAELTQQLSHGHEAENRQNISRALFVEDLNSLGIMENEKNQRGQEMNNKEVGRDSTESQWTGEKGQSQIGHDELMDAGQYRDIQRGVTNIHTRSGFPTELIFIKNYMFEFFTFLKSNPDTEKQLLTNLLSVPYDNEHLLTCYRTQLSDIEADYYHTRIEGQFLAYPYWKNLIDYEPILSTQLFHQFSLWIEQRTSQNQEDLGFSITEHQQNIFRLKFSQENISLKEIQRIFLMMLMDAFNEAFEEERCAYRQIALVRHQKGGMANEQIVRKTLKTIQEIQTIEKSAPAYYQDPNLITYTQPSSTEQQPHLESSQTYQFFITHSLRQKKQQLIDTIFCSVLKRVLENWGRSMCGLIIEPEEQDEMQITMEQIQTKNTERLCLALNRYVEEYEKELTNIIREHELCAKLVVADQVLEGLLEEFTKEVWKRVKNDRNCY